MRATYWMFVFQERISWRFAGWESIVFLCGRSWCYRCCCRSVRTPDPWNAGFCGAGRNGVYCLWLCWSTGFLQVAGLIRDRSRLFLFFFSFLAPLWRTVRCSRWRRMRYVRPWRYHLSCEWMPIFFPIYDLTGSTDINFGKCRSRVVRKHLREVYGCVRPLRPRKSYSRFRFRVYRYARM